MYPRVAPPVQEDARSALKPGKTVFLNGVPCCIDEVKTSKTGKHGHAKHVVRGHSVEESKERKVELPRKSIEVVFTSHDRPKTFQVVKGSFDVVAAHEENGFQVLDENGELLHFPFPADSRYLMDLVRTDLERYACKLNVKFFPKTEAWDGCNEDPAAFIESFLVEPITD